MTSQLGKKRRVGVLGYGHLGQYLVQALCQDAHLSSRFELVFVWNRTPLSAASLPTAVPFLNRIDDFADFSPDLIVEVAHPQVSREWAKTFLDHCDYLMVSPTVFCDRAWQDDLLTYLRQAKHGLYLAKGALAGISDLIELGQNGLVQRLRVTMEKAPESLYFLGPLPAGCPAELKDLQEPLSLFRGSVRQLAAFAPRNVNAMVVAALASGLGLDQTQGELLATPGLKTHRVSWEVTEDKGFSLSVERINPATSGAVTGAMTYLSCKLSLLRAQGAGAGGPFFC